jgi:Ca2+-binding EF-hand superfamily protein
MKDVIRRNEKRADEAMAKCDANKDGRISANEVEKVSYDEIDFSKGKPDDCRVPAPVLENMDLNGDGIITRQEIITSADVSRRPPRRMRKVMKKQQQERMRKFQKKQFKRCDKDQSNYLTLREAASMKCNIYTEMFDARDKDGDQLISVEEMMADVKPPRFEVEDVADKKRIIEQERKMPPHISLQRKMFECDKNGNGKLDIAETASKECEVDLSYFNSVDANADKAIDSIELRRVRMKVQFDQLDKNKDSFLDKKEFIGSRIRYM